MLTAPFIQPHLGQQQIMNAPYRFRVLACGRRFGKTTVGQLLIVDYALRGAKTWWLAPTYQMASQVWRNLKTMTLDSCVTSHNETEQRLDIVGGGSIAIRSTHLPDNLRGEGLDFAVLDEAAFMHPSVWPEVVRPMLADRPGGALFLSTPNGRNWFWELYKIGLDPEEDEWASFHFRSHDNPYISRDELDAIERITPPRVWRAEYLAEFIDDAGQVFRGIREAARAPLDAQPVSGRRYVAGVDWGRDIDYTCIVVIDAQTRQMVAIDRFNRIGWEFQRERLKIVCDRWRPAVIWAEANSMGAPNIEALQREGLPVRPFMTTARTKAPLIESLALAIERRELALLPDEVLLGELASYTLERLPAGGYRYTAPAGSHDDTVVALALAWYAARHGGPLIDFV